MMRIPKRVFQLTPWTTNIPPGMTGERLENYLKELCYANGLCILSWARGLPIFEEYGLMLLRVSG